MTKEFVDGYVHLQRVREGTWDDSTMAVRPEPAAFVAPPVPQAAGPMTRTLYTSEQRARMINLETWRNESMTTDPRDGAAPPTMESEFARGHAAGYEAGFKAGLMEGETNQ